MLFLIHWKSFEFSTWPTREMFIWLKNSTLGISNSEDFHYLHWRLVADYPGHVTTYFRTQCQRPVHPKDLICDIWHSIKIKYPYTKPQSPTPFNSNSHPSHFCTKLWSKTFPWNPYLLSKNGIRGIFIVVFYLSESVYDKYFKCGQSFFKASEIETSYLAWQLHLPSPFKQHKFRGLCDNDCDYY